jgi:hypothetical protein
MAKQWGPLYLPAGSHIPEDVRIYGIEVKELSRFSQGCTPEITEKLSARSPKDNKIVEHILGDLSGN